MNTVRIITAQKVLPAYSRSTPEILPYVSKWLEGEPDRLVRKALKIFEGAGVDTRYGIMDLKEVFSPESFEDKNEQYVRASKELGQKVLSKALEEAGWEGSELDYIITVSCTGIMIPSLDAYLINALELREDIVRLPVTEMGCVAGISGLIYANRFLKSHPGKRAAVVAFESPTATFQHGDHSMANIVSAALFGDGASCVLLSSAKEDSGPEILAEGMYHFADATHLMGFQLTNSGLKMLLDPEVPETIAAHFIPMLQPIFQEQNIGLEDLRHLIFHPGGRKIVETVSEVFADLPAGLDDTREVLRQYGNMSSVTVLYVLERFMKKSIKAGELGLMLSFGPGFTAQRILLRF
ncbi:type III polyketide synthase [Robiginitalea sp. IMCC44478]|uniref:type III polyketide synthase n=1 Tax=Robiginitalea sp. IMCC44478 TaxID=3459122 RepID=UPI004042241B